MLYIGFFTSLFLVENTAAYNLSVPPSSLRQAASDNIVEILAEPAGPALVMAVFGVLFPLMSTAIQCGGHSPAWF